MNIYICTDIYEYIYDAMSASHQLHVSPDLFFARSTSGALYLQLSELINDNVF